MPYFDHLLSKTAKYVLCQYRAQMFEIYHHLFGYTVKKSTYNN